jgi:hypothetical protein
MFTWTADNKLYITVSPSLEKPPIAQLLKNFPTFYGTQKPATGPYPKPHESSSALTHDFFKILF